MINKPPEIHDLVAVTIKHVDYYGYISHIDWDMRCPSIVVEFYPGHERTFDFGEIKLVDHPRERT